MTPRLARFFPLVAGACSYGGYKRRHERIAQDQESDGLLLTDEQVEQLLMFLRERLNPSDMGAFQQLILGQSDDPGDLSVDQVPPGAALPGGGQQPFDQQQARAIGAADAAFRKATARAKLANASDIESRFPGFHRIRQL